jgi:hypothetical protein
VHPVRFKRSFWIAVALAIASLLLSVSALAQGSAVLTGTARDAETKRPIADVLVTATSPALQGEQIVVTDATGQYRIPNLPPGVYTVRLDRESYKPFARGDIQLRVGSTIRLNIDLLPEALKEEIIVKGSAPVIDVGSATTGVNVGSDFASRIAVSPPSGKGGATRSFESLAEVAPGAAPDRYGVSISGTTSPENQYVIDGLSVNNPAFGILGTQLPVEFVKEVNIIAGGYLPEYGRATGGYLDVVTKSGGNEFHGSIFSSIAPGIFEGAREEIRREGSTISTVTSPPPSAASASKSAARSSRTGSGSTPASPPRSPRIASSAASISSGSTITAPPSPTPLASPRRTRSPAPRRPTTPPSGASSILASSRSSSTPTTLSPSPSTGLPRPPAATATLVLTPATAASSSSTRTRTASPTAPTPPSPIIMSRAPTTYPSNGRRRSRTRQSSSTLSSGGTTKRTPSAPTTAPSSRAARARLPSARSSGSAPTRASTQSTTSSAAPRPRAATRPAPRTPPYAPSPPITAADLASSMRPPSTASRPRASSRTSSRGSATTSPRPASISSS